MPKKDKQNAQPETPEKEPQAAAAEEKELPPEDKKEEAKAETFTVTREQMEKMEGLAKQLAEEHDQYLRLAAEYDNYRKRTAKEKEGIYANAKIDTIKGMNVSIVTTAKTPGSFLALPSTLPASFGTQKE